MKGRREKTKFFLAAAIGLAFFFLPVKFRGKFTVPFDIIVTSIRKSFPYSVEVYSFVTILAGAILTILALFSPKLRKFSTTKTIFFLRLAGVAIAFTMFFQKGPHFLLEKSLRDLMWLTLVPSVAVIIPVGAAVVNLLTSAGVLDFIGILATPLMKPLFKVPGRAALDMITSWVGSYSVGLYMTRNIFEKGGYSKKHAFIIATCFSTVSIGFVGVVASTLNILHLFPYIFIGYFLAIFITAAVLVRVPPISKIPDEYITTPLPEPEPEGNLLKTAYYHGILTASSARGILYLLFKGFIDGLFLSSLILGTILSVGTIAMLLADKTGIFSWISTPFLPLYKLLGLPDPDKLAMATIIEIAEMYLPSLLMVNSPLISKFFIAVLSISQLIFFSSVGPMMMDMFKEIPIKTSHLIIIFLERTLIIIPIAYLYTWVLFSSGLIQ